MIKIIHRIAIATAILALVSSAAFYLKSVAPSHITLIKIFRGFEPFIVLQIIVLLLVMFFPGITQTFHTFE